MRVPTSWRWVNRPRQGQWLAQIHRSNEESSWTQRLSPEGALTSRLSWTIQILNFLSHCQSWLLFCFFIWKIWSLNWQNLQHHDFLERRESKEGKYGEETLLYKNWNKGHWQPCIDGQINLKWATNSILEFLCQQILSEQCTLRDFLYSRSLTF